MNGTSSRFIAQTIHMLAGLLIWAAHLGLVYGVTALACARGFADMAVLGIGVVPLAIGCATLAALLATAFVLRQAMRDLGEPHTLSESRETRRFIDFTTATVAGLALVAIVWNGLPALVIPACA